MSKRWSCDTLGEGFQHVMTEAVHDEEAKLLKEIQDPSQLRSNRIQICLLYMIQFQHVAYYTPMSNSIRRTWKQNLLNYLQTSWTLLSRVAPRVKSEPEIKTSKAEVDNCCQVRSNLLILLKRFLQQAPQPQSLLM